IQHEMDHLNGVIFVDYLSRLKQTRARDKVRKVLKIREKQEAQSAEKQTQAVNS
ncbi:peptide deformylase, partial [Marinobacter sp. 1Y8]